MLGEYRDIFAMNLEEIGETKLVQLKIELETNIPIDHTPYRIPIQKKQIVNDMVQELLANDIISRSDSEYASPITLVKKNDGSDRFCVDYPLLNKHMPKQSQCLIKKNVCKKPHDINSGYYQIPIENDSQKFTAFVTTEGIYEFKRIPFGLKNAPIVFQRLMAKIKDNSSSCVRS